MSNEHRDMGLECLHPFPPAEQVSGFYAFGDDVWMPSQCGLSMNELEDEPDLFDGGLLLERIRWEDGSFATLEESVEFVLEALNLPALERFEGDNDIREHLEDREQENSREFETGFEVKRKQFEELFELVASSDYVQFSEKPDVGYTLREPRDKAEREKLLQFYRHKYRDELQDLDLATLDIRPIVDRKMNLAGFVSYHPTHFFLIKDMLRNELGKPGESYYWTGWQDES